MYEFYTSMWGFPPFQSFCSPFAQEKASDGPKNVSPDALLEYMTRYFIEPLQKMHSELMDSSIAPSRDRRFQDQAWEDQPYFRYLRDSYLANVCQITLLLETYLPKDMPERDLILFSLKNFFEFLSPSNFPWSNPEVIRETIDRKGENLKEGLYNFLKDQQNPMTRGLPAPTQFDVFQVGKNLATTKGTVVFQNKICQLIYYTPLCDINYETPLLIIPPWINKYYILDLNDQLSFVKWNLYEGRPVFMISWANPDASFKDVTFEDYIFQGIQACLEFILKELLLHNRTQQVNLLSFCISGVATLCFLSYAQQQRLDLFKAIKSTTLLATPVDFSYLKNFTMFATPRLLDFLNQQKEFFGFISGAQMVQMFSMLRSQDMIWSHFVNNYLMGKIPPSIDFLYWNSDTTNLAPTAHIEYLTHFLLNNAFFNKDYALRIDNILIQLDTITTPLCAIATKRDHIVPWESLFELYKKIPHTHFMLGDSGHIAGIVNPPALNKYGFWSPKALEESAKGPLTAHEWLQGVTRESGSWWAKWSQWMTPFDGHLTGSFQASHPLEEAPGSYVLAPLPMPFFQR